MFKKKYFFLIICMIFLSTSMSSNALAASISENDNLPESARSLPSSGEFSPTSSSINTLSTSCVPVFKYNVKLKDPLLSAANAFATSEAFQNCNGKVTKDNIEMVYARAKLYKKGAFMTDSKDTTYNGSYAGARAKNKTGTTTGLEAYGEHTFKKKGYMEHNFNTYDK